MINAQSLETAYYIRKSILPVALSLLPGKMTSDGAVAMIMAIGLQESEFRARVQGGNGPAHGFGQFERAGGVTEILTSPVTRPVLLPILELLCVKPTAAICYDAIVYNDVLALVFMRLLLWKYPGALPREHELEKGWTQYEAAWRPGRPRPQAWPDNFIEGWRLAIHE